MQEIWKDIKEYEGYYQISNIGRVKSLSRKVKQFYGYRVNKEKIMGHKHTKKWQATITINGEYKYLGLFFSQEEANVAYQEKLKEVVSNANN